VILFLAFVGIVVLMRQPDSLTASFPAIGSTSPPPSTSVPGQASISTSALVSTPTSKPTSLGVESAPIYAEVNAPRGSAVLRATPGGAGIATVENFTYVELLPETEQASGYTWAHVIALVNGSEQEGWIVQQYLGAPTSGGRASPSLAAPQAPSLGLPPGSMFTTQNTYGEKWQLRVIRTETAESLTSTASGAIEKAAGRFAILFLEVTNLGLSRNTFLAGAFLNIEDAAGRRYEENYLATAFVQFAYNTDLCANINPDATASCVAVYDVSEQSDYYRFVPSMLADPTTPKVLVEIP
jgi:hypothetical protein